MRIQGLEQSVAQMPTADDWLGPGEKLRLATMRFPKRRTDWRLGRWTAKLAVADYLRLDADPQSMACVEIRPADCGAPEVFLDNQPAPVSISISHRAGIALCIAAPPDATIGCDIELIEPRSNAFLSDYFTTSEQALVSNAPAERRSIVSNLIWSAKESALKALKVGLRSDTRSVEVDFSEGALTDGDALLPNTSYLPPFEISDQERYWHPLSVTCVVDHQRFQGWWLVAGQLVRTIVALAAVKDA